MTVTMDQEKKKLKRKLGKNKLAFAQPQPQVPPAKKAKLATDTQKSATPKAPTAEAQKTTGAKTGLVKKAKKRHKKKKKVSASGTTVTQNGESVTGVVNGDSKKALKKKKKKFSKFKKAEDKGETTTVRLPVEPDAISCNWKNLLKTIESEKKPPKQNPCIFFSAARKKKMNEEKIYSVKKDLKQQVVPEVKKKKPEIWFDDVDECLLDIEDRPASKSTDSKPDTDAENSLVKEGSFKGATKIIGMDCEMVGVGFGGKDSILARVSIVNHFGNCIYDKYVKPREKVTDYRTAVSGIRPKDIEHGEDFMVVQKEVSDLLKNRILVGHALKHDMKVLFLDHPRKSIRDTSTYKYFRNSFGGKTPSLKRLSERMLGVTVQEGEHSSVQDAQAAVRLYTMFRKEWELAIKNRSTRKNSVEKDSSKNVESSTESTTKPEVVIKPVVKKSAQKAVTRPLYTDSD